MESCEAAWEQIVLLLCMCTMQVVKSFDSIQLFLASSGNSQNYWPEVLDMTWELLPEAEWSPEPRDNNFDSSLNRHEITVLLSYIHALNHQSTEDDNVSIPYLVTMEKRLTGMMHCASFSGMEQFGSGGRGTVNCFTLPAIFYFFSCNQLEI
jgi:hypothetical protein